MRLAWLILVAACGGGSNVDATGDYTIAVTFRDNGCNFQNWNVNDMASGIPVTVTQDAGDTATADIGGGARTLLDFALGGHTFTGPVDGHHLKLELAGRGMQMGNCAFSFNSEIDANLSGDVLEGEIDYRGVTNKNPDCGSLEGCLSVL